MKILIFFTLTFLLLQPCARASTDEPLSEQEIQQQLLTEAYETFMLHHIIGEKPLILAGFYQEKSLVAVAGKGELHEKVRVTLINGMLNIHSFAKENAQMISATHGDINIHYIFRPTLGWTQDLVKSTVAKFGYVTTEARLLAKTWKRLIQEMGGAENGGIIIHYAHSIGGADTVNATRFLTPEEQKMIRVISLGSPIMIPHDGFHGVVNYISLRDGILFLAPLSHLATSYWNNTQIVYLDGYMGIPVCDHLLGSNTYKTLLQALGQEFLQTFIYSTASQAP